MWPHQPGPSLQSFLGPSTICPPNLSSYFCHKCGQQNSRNTDKRHHMSSTFLSQLVWQIKPPGLKKYRLESSHGLHIPLHTVVTNVATMTREIRMWCTTWPSHISPPCIFPESLNRTFLDNRVPWNISKGRNVREGERPKSGTNFLTSPWFPDFPLKHSLRLNMVSMATLHPRLYEQDHQRMMVDPMLLIV